MNTESTTSSELLRNKIHRLNKSQKERIVLFFDTFLNLTWETKEDYFIYLGGSQSKHSKKLPCESSDVDIYLFVDKINFVTAGRMIHFDEIISEQAQLSLGMKINVYLVDKRFIESVSQGMELLK
jgi:hypothetical protein